MSELSNKKKPIVTESLGGRGARRPASAQGQARSRSGPPSAARSSLPALRVDPLDHRALLRAGARRADRSADVHEGDPHRLDASSSCVGLPVAIWWFIIRPWRRERRITLDGMLLVSMGLLFFQDPLLNYFNTWCTYNTWLFNRGSWVRTFRVGCPRGTGRHGGRTPADERARLRVRRPAVHHPRLLGHAQGQGALAQHQHLG